MRQEWISVKDRLPENHTYVLVLKKDGVSQQVARFSNYNTTYGYDFNEQWFCKNGGNQFNAAAITHWMPLPAPPPSTTPNSSNN